MGSVLGQKNDKVWLYVPGRGHKNETSESHAKKEIPLTYFELMLNGLEPVCIFTGRRQPQAEPPGLQLALGTCSVQTW